MFRWKLYILQETKHTDSKNEVMQSVCYDSLLSMNEFSVHFDLHRQQYQHLRVHRCLLEKSADTVNGIYTYLPLIFVYSTLAVSRLPEPENKDDRCCPGDQQTIVLENKVEPYTSKRCLTESPGPDDMALVLTDHPDCPHVHCDLPDPHYKMLIDTYLRKPSMYGIYRIGKHIKLDTWGEM